jgi:hypothetical protein
MRIIYPDLITAVVANEENSEYLDENLIDEHSSKPWKAESKDATITATVASGATGVALINTNAKNASVTVDGGAATEYNASDASTRSIIHTYTDPEALHDVVWTLGTGDAGIILQAGLVSAGTVLSFSDPHYGIQEGLVDFGISKVLSNGALYTKHIKVARTFSGVLTLDRDTDFYSFMLTFARENGPKPFVCQISSGTITDHQFIVYVSFQGNMPQGVHHTPNYSQLSFQFTEAL